jgi:hypothetical protein
MYAFIAAACREGRAKRRGSEDKREARQSSRADEMEAR